MALLPANGSQSVIERDLVDQLTRVGTITLCLVGDVDFGVSLCRQMRHPLQLHMMQFGA